MSIDWTSDELTFGDVLGPVVGIAERGDLGERDAYLAEYVVYLSKRNPEFTGEQIRKTIDSNIGYWSGYYSPETMQRIKAFFGVRHPVFDR